MLYRSLGQEKLNALRKRKMNVRKIHGHRNSWTALTGHGKLV